MKLLNASGWLVAILVTAGGCMQTTTCPVADPAQARTEALETLDSAGNSQNAFTRAHVIEAVSTTLCDQAGRVYERGLRDCDPAVRYVAAIAVGELKYARAKRIPLEMVQQDDRARPPRAAGRDLRAEPCRVSTSMPAGPVAVRQGRKCGPTRPWRWA